MKAIPQSDPNSLNGGLGNDAKSRRLPASIKHELRRMTDTMRKAGQPDEIGDETVTGHPESVYRPPWFLVQTATPELVAELADVFTEISQLNEDCVGFATREAEAILAITGVSLPIIRRLWVWTERYIRGRLSVASFNPKDGGFPRRTYVRLLGELEDVLKLTMVPRSIHYVITTPAKQFGAWLLFRETCGHHIRAVPSGRPNELVFHVTSSMPRESDLELQTVVDWAVESYWYVDLLGQFAERIAAAPAIITPQIKTMSEDALRRDLAAIAADIQEMRPFLVANFRPEITGVSLGDGQPTLYWSWTAWPGIGKLIAALDEREIRLHTHTMKSVPLAIVNSEGIFVDYHLPWIAPADRVGRSRELSLALNAQLLHLVRDRLFDLYMRVDFERVRRRWRDLSSWEEEGADQVVAASCHELAHDSAADLGDDVEGSQDAGIAELPTADAKRRLERVPSLRLQRLLRLLGRLGCEITPARGSEIAVYRAGGRKFVLGRHGRNPQVSSNIVQALLRRVAISPREWFSLLA